MMRGFLRHCYAILIPAIAACSNPATPAPPNDCGAVCGGTGPITAQVVNPTTTYTVRFAWWWRGKLADSVMVAPSSSTCVHFIGVTWAQIEGFYGDAGYWTGARGGAYGSDAFDPLVKPNWRLEAQPAQTVPYASYGFAVTNPSTAC